MRAVLAVLGVDRRLYCVATISYRAAVLSVAVLKCPAVCHHSAHVSCVGLHLPDEDER